MREKELGNECFKSDDYEEALRHYNTSISIYSTPEACNNRAMACKYNNVTCFFINNIDFMSNLSFYETFLVFNSVINFSQKSTVLLLIEILFWYTKTFLNFIL